MHLLWIPLQPLAHIWRILFAGRLATQPLEEASALRAAIDDLRKTYPDAPNVWLEIVARNKSGQATDTLEDALPLEAPAGVEINRAESGQGAASSADLSIVAPKPRKTILRPSEALAAKQAGKQKPSEKPDVNVKEEISQPVLAHPPRKATAFASGSPNLLRAPRLVLRNIIPLDGTVRMSEPAASAFPLAVTPVPSLSCLPKPLTSSTGTDRNRSLRPQDSSPARPPPAKTSQREVFTTQLAASTKGATLPKSFPAASVPVKGSSYSDCSDLPVSEALPYGAVSSETASWPWIPKVFDGIFRFVTSSAKFNIPRRHIFAHDQGPPPRLTASGSSLLYKIPFWRTVPASNLTPATGTKWSEPFPSDLWPPLGPSEPPYAIDHYTNHLGGAQNLLRLIRIQEER